MEIKDKLIDIKIQNLFQERIIDEKKAELLLTIALVKNYNKGVKINIASILNCSSNFELGVKEMALHDIKNAHFNYLCIGNTLIQDTHPDFAKLMKEKFNLILIRAHYSYKVPNYLFKLCNIYNTIVIEELGKKYGKDFFGKTTDKFLEEKKL